MKKWIEKEQRYVPYSIPKGWHCPLRCDDFDEIVNCANCGIERPFWDTYTSMTIHTNYGMGYNICPDCHQREYMECKECEKARRNSHED